MNNLAGGISQSRDIRKSFSFILVGRANARITLEESGIRKTAILQLYPF